MRSYNKVILVGKVVQNPELRMTPMGKSVLRIRLASRNPSKKSANLFIDVYAFGRLAEMLNEKVEKGNSVLVDGSIAYSEWVDSSGIKRNKYEIWASSIQFLDALPPEQQEELLLGSESESEFGFMDFDDEDDLPPF